MKTIILIVLTVIFGNLFSQNLKEDLLKMEKAYEQLTIFNTTIVTKAYENGKIAYSLKINFVKKGDNYYVKSPLYDYIRNKNYSIMVLHKNKTITYRKREKERDAEMDNMVQEFEISEYLDTILTLYDKITFIGIKEGNKIYKFEKKNSLLPVVKLYLEKESHLIAKLIYLYNEESYSSYSQVIINYTNNKSNINDSVFNESNYFFLKQGKVIPTKKFINYHVYDNSKEY